MDEISLAQLFEREVVCSQVVLLQKSMIISALDPQQRRENFLWLTCFPLKYFSIIEFV